MEIDTSVNCPSQIALFYQAGSAHVEGENLGFLVLTDPLVK